MADRIPRFIAINMGGRYLEYVEGGDLHGFVKSSGMEVVSPFTKFQIERSESSELLVHIKCCYNNKYLVRRSQTEQWIVAGANEPEEDQSKWSCTLIRPLETMPNRFLFEVVFPSSSKQYLNFYGFSPDKYFQCLIVSPRGNTGSLVLDMDSLIIMPRFFALKGDNDRYLTSTWIEGHEYHQFQANVDILNRRAHYEAFYTPDGNLRVKSNFFGKFWRRSPNWIWADSTDTFFNNRDTLFRPSRLLSEGNNVITLTNLGNNRFCKRLTAERKSDCLNAATDNIETFARFKVEQAVSSRVIDNVQYRLDDARIYDLTPVVTVSKDVSNRTSGTTMTGELSFTYSETNSSSWNSTHSWNISISTTINAGIPILVEGSISITTSIGGSYQWGQEVVTSETRNVKEEVPMPPMTKTTVTMVVARGAIDVPFSYTQRDTLPDGTRLPAITLHDGIFHGVSMYITFDTKEESL